MSQPSPEATAPEGPDVGSSRVRGGVAAVVLAVVATFVAMFSVSGGATAVFQQGATAVEVAERVVAEHPDGLLRFPINPVPRCVIADNFGGVSKAGRPSGHEGVDIGADEWQEVYAIEHGVLERRLDDLSSAPGLGWVVLGDSQTQYRYYHLAGFAAGLEVGDRVTPGQLIGYVGSTGNAAPTGWHLHFEIRPGPQPERGAADAVDPVPLLDIPESCLRF